MENKSAVDKLIEHLQQSYHLLPETLNEFEKALQLEKEQKKVLQHHYDTTIGLYAIDRNPNEVSLEWIRENAFRIEKEQSIENENVKQSIKIVIDAIEKDDGKQANIHFIMDGAATDDFILSVLMKVILIETNLSKFFIAAYQQIINEASLQHLESQK